MAKRLVKIAKELNVGTSTIVEFLNLNGFEIDNKPTAKITDGMYEELLKEFEKSIDIKEKSRQINIGSRNVKKEDEENEVNVVTAPTAQEAPVVPENSEKVPADQIAKEEITRVEVPKLKLKTVGKINLNERLQQRAGKKTETPTPETKKEETKAPAAKKETKAPAAKKETPPPAKPKEIEKVEEVKAPEPIVNKTDSAENQEPDAPEKKVDDNEIVRSKTPELRGLKILGKIDTDKFQKPKKKKKPETTAREKKETSGDKPATNKPTTAKPTGDQPQRKKRRRKKVVIEGNNPGGTGTGTGTGPRTGTGTGGGERKERRRVDRGKSATGGGGQGSRRDEVREVSKKEIEEKIKATMARLQGGGRKNRRQKLQRDKRDRLKEKQEQLEAQQETGKLEVTEFISVSELASIMNVDVTDVITTCLNLGIIVSINQRLDAEIIELVAEEFGHEVEFINAEEQLEEEVEEIVDDPADLESRNPIVTVMGHVDHGKTSLLDYIREANVASGEAGGITQHIGAYEVKTESGQGVTFLDTPGHEAFTAMRARGAKVTDIAIIIIAADDNIMPQTREAISHAQAAGVPMVFAINKVDKDGAQPERIKQELASMNFLVEAWGGTYQSHDISAKTGQGIDELIEKVLLEAEILELKANPKRMATGTVLEASLEKGRGYVTKLLIENGTLNVGDPIVAGEYAGKIRAMLNERGKRIKAAGPSKPVMILGLSGAPQAGERMKEMPNEQEAKTLAVKRAQISREQANRATKRISLDEIGRRLALGTFKELNLIVKGDVDGSVEALSDSLIKLSVETVQVNVIHKAVGQIAESDVLLASASDAIIIGFQVRPSLNARKLAEREGVQIKTYSIIYETIEEIKMAIEGMLEPTKEEKILGEVEVRETFKISKVGTIAGCYVKDGKVARNNHIRLIRDGIVVYPSKEGAHGHLASLKRFKEDVREVKNGLECGLGIENFNDIKVGDIVEAYEIIEIKQTLD